MYLVSMLAVEPACLSNPPTGTNQLPFEPTLVILLKMNAELKTYRFPQGLRPGMRHEGQFKPQRLLPNGRTLASLARDYTEESVNVLVSVVTGQMTDVRPSDRIRAAEILLDRGWGKPTETVQLELSAANVRGLTTTELMAIASGALPPIDGEATVVTTSLPPQHDCEEVS